MNSKKLLNECQSPMKIANWMERQSQFQRINIWRVMCYEVESKGQ